MYIKKVVLLVNNHWKTQTTNLLHIVKREAWNQSFCSRHLDISLILD